MNTPARILLVEDDRILRRAGEVVLGKKGYEVVVAVDGEEALVKVREHKPDLILLDVMMPKLDGFEVLTRLKDDPATRDIPVIMLSNLSEPSEIKKAADRGARAYLVKSSLRPEQLAEKVAETLARPG
jgi:two-component system, OmpR family, alkaline phosphatase synthesis response regulator PhoP